MCIQIDWICGDHLYCRYLVSKCAQLTHLSLDLGEEEIAVQTLEALSKHCLQLQVLQLHGLKDQGPPYCRFNFVHSYHSFYSMARSKRT